MSAEGIRAAKWVGRVQPVRAACLAAELRNAVTPASLVVSEFACQSLFQEELGDLQATVAHILALADALQPGGAELPTGPDPLRDRCACGSHQWRVTASPTAPIIRCDSCGRLASAAIAPPERDSSGGHEMYGAELVAEADKVPGLFEDSDDCIEGYRG